MKIDSSSRMLWLAGALAAMALVIAAIPIYYVLTTSVAPVSNPQPAPQVASVASSIDALWGGESVPDAEGWLPSGPVELRRGQAVVRFSSGVMVALKAPSEFQAISPVEARLKLGSMTAQVDGTKTSFRIHTPAAEVVDLGTRFGVAVARSGDTDLAVFDGLVEVGFAPDRKSSQSEPVPASPATRWRRLSAGEALHIDRQGQSRRLATVTDDHFPRLTHPQQAAAEPPLISAISDNLRDEETSPKFYRIVTRGFVEDAPAYVDRNYQWNGIDESGIPNVLRGADYVMTFNDDRRKHSHEITITLTRPATIYVLYSNLDIEKQKTPPAWLTRSFERTGMQIGMDEDSRGFSDARLGVGPGESVDYVFSIWKRDVGQPGSLVLGRRQSKEQAMYGIVVVPLEVAKSPSRDVSKL
ncbi:MAG: FecR family protein [Pirellulales bacterium]